MPVGCVGRLGERKVGDQVNLERAMGAHVRFGGHFVQVSFGSSDPFAGRGPQLSVTKLADANFSFSSDVSASRRRLEKKSTLRLCRHARSRVAQPQP